MKKQFGDRLIGEYQDGDDSKFKIWIGNPIDGTHPSKVFLSVDRPQNIAIIGPSGCGKTMLSSVICEGLSYPSQSPIKDFSTSIPNVFLDLLGNMQGIKQLKGKFSSEYSPDKFDQSIKLKYIPVMCTKEPENFNKSFLNINVNLGESSDDEIEISELREPLSDSEKLTIDFKKISLEGIYDLLHINERRDTNMADIIRNAMLSKPSSPGELLNNLQEMENTIETQSYYQAWQKIKDRVESLVTHEIFDDIETDIISDLKQKKTIVINCRESIMKSKEVTDLWLKLQLENLISARDKASQIEKRKLRLNQNIELDGHLLPFWLMIDEAHRLSSKSFAQVNDFIRTARNWACSCVIATQSIDDIDPIVRKNLTVLFLGRMSEREAVRALKDFPISSNQLKIVREIKNLLPGQFLVLDKIGGQVFYLNTRERVTIHLGETERTSDIMQLYDTAAAVDA